MGPNLTLKSISSKRNVLLREVFRLGKIKGLSVREALDFQMVRKSPTIQHAFGGLGKGFTSTRLASNFALCVD